MNLCKVNVCVSAGVFLSLGLSQSHANVASEEKSLHCCSRRQFWCLLSQLLCVQWNEADWSHGRWKKWDGWFSAETQEQDLTLGTGATQITLGSPSGGWLRCSSWRLSRHEPVEHDADWKLGMNKVLFEFLCVFVVALRDQTRLETAQQRRNTKSRRAATVVRCLFVLCFRCFGCKCYPSSCTRLCGESDICHNCGVVCVSPQSRNCVVVFFTCIIYWVCVFFSSLVLWGLI